MSKDFWKAGHTPTLLVSFLYFDLSFMVWYILGPLAIQIAEALQLSAQQRGLMVATPILAGALLRFGMGLLVDRFSPKFAGILGQVVVMLALGFAWLHGIQSLSQALLLGVFLGVAGAAFAVSLTLVIGALLTVTLGARMLMGKTKRAPVYVKAKRRDDVRVWNDGKGTIIDL